MRDSSLSACTQAVIAAEVGHLELAYDYLAEAALMDLDDLEHNTRDGAAHRVAGRHLDRGGRRLRRHARPRRRAELHARGCRPALTRLRVPADLPRAPAAGRGRARAGDLLAARRAPLEIAHHDETATLTPDGPVTLEVPPAPARAADAARRPRAGETQEGREAGPRATSRGCRGKRGLSARSSATRPLSRSYIGGCGVDPATQCRRRLRAPR